MLLQTLSPPVDYVGKHLRICHFKSCAITFSNNQIFEGTGRFFILLWKFLWPLVKTRVASYLSLFARSSILIGLTWIYPPFLQTMPLYFFPFLGMRLTDFCDENVRDIASLPSLEAAVHSLYCQHPKWALQEEDVLENERKSQFVDNIVASWKKDDPDWSLKPTPLEELVLRLFRAFVHRLNSADPSPPLLVSIFFSSSGTLPPLNELKEKAFDEACSCCWELVPRQAYMVQGRRELVERAIQILKAVDPNASKTLEYIDTFLATLTSWLSKK